MQFPISFLKAIYIVYQKKGYGVKAVFFDQKPFILSRTCIIFLFTPLDIKYLTG
jgi:hypothetical protein